jgi:hypothetical protein
LWEWLNGISEEHGVGFYGDSNPFGLVGFGFNRLLSETVCLQLILILARLFFEITHKLCTSIFFFRKFYNSSNNLIKSNKNYKWCHLEKTTNTRRAKSVLPSSPELGKSYRSRDCYSRHTISRRAKAAKDQRARGETITNNDDHRWKRLT